jgi:trehalose 6-phosphate phosphatase
MASLKPLWLSVGSLCERLRSSESLYLGLDFDGTLTPIADHPSTAALSPRSREVLERLSQREGVKMAVLSGRNLDDLQDKVGLNGVFLVGSSGLETQDANGRREIHVNPDQAIPMELVQELESWCLRFPGSWLENKTSSCALHYRAVAPSLQPAFGAGVRRRIRPYQTQATLVHGKCVFEVMPAVGWDKAAALGRWLDSAPANATLLYFGDDTHDEPVHAKVRARGGFAVAIGRIVSQAEYVLPTPGDVVWFLEWLDREWPMCAEPRQEARETIQIETETPVSIDTDPALTPQTA